MTDDYSDIINLPYRKSKKHPPMPVHDRAAQFAPFAALTGYDEAIDETARLTDKKLELSEEQIRMLNEKMHWLEENLGSRPMVTVYFFVPDSKKAGGSYMTVHGNVRRIDHTERKLIFTDDYKVNIDDIYTLI